MVARSEVLELRVELVVAMVESLAVEERQAWV